MNTLYVHGSSVRHKLGTTLKARLRPTEFSHRESVDGVGIEAFVESFRPPTEVSRLKCIFLVKYRCTLNIAGAAENHVYVVQTIGHVTKAHFGWIHALMILRKPFRSSRVAATYAKNYWAGVPYRGPWSATAWEYLASEVRIALDISQECPTKAWKLTA